MTLDAEERTATTRKIRDTRHQTEEGDTGRRRIPGVEKILDVNNTEAR